MTHKNSKKHRSSRYLFTTKCLTLNHQSVYLHCDNVMKASLCSYVYGFKESYKKTFPSNIFIKKLINILWFK